MTFEEMTDFGLTLITPAYAGIMALMLVYLSWRVVSLRKKYETKMGDEGHSELTAAVRAHGNLLEYLPTALLLLLLLEFLSFSSWVIHALGLLLVGARIIHLKGINAPSGKSLNRRLGTRLTWAQMTIASLLCLLGAFDVTF